MLEAFLDGCSLGSSLEIFSDDFESGDTDAWSNPFPWIDRRLAYQPRHKGPSAMSQSRKVRTR